MYHNLYVVEEEIRRKMADLNAGKVSPVIRQSPAPATKARVLDRAMLSLGERLLTVGYALTSRAHAAGR